MLYYYPVIIKEEASTETHNDRMKSKKYYAEYKESAKWYDSISITSKIMQN